MNGDFYHGSVTCACAIMYYALRNHLERYRDDAQRIPASATAAATQSQGGVCVRHAENFNALKIPASLEPHSNASASGPGVRLLCLLVGGMPGGAVLTCLCRVKSGGCCLAYDVNLRNRMATDHHQMLAANAAYVARREMMTAGFFSRRGVNSPHTVQAQSSI